MTPKIPKYLVKWPDEAGWILWIGTLVGVWSAIALSLGVDGGIVSAVALFIATTGRVFTGVLLPTPSLQQEIKSAAEHIDDQPKLTDK